MLPNADDQAADEIDEQNQDCGNGIAAHEFAGAVHGAEEIGFMRDLPATLRGVFLVYQAGIEIGIDRHLLAGHAVQREPGGDFGDAARALGDDDKIDDDQNRENDDSDGVIAADHERAERFDHPARGRGALIAFKQDDPSRRDV